MQVTILQDRHELLLFRINDNLAEQTVDQWISNPSNHPCGEVIGDWEVGRVTDMSLVFCADIVVPLMLIFRNGTRQE